MIFISLSLYWKKSLFLSLSLSILFECGNIGDDEDWQIFCNLEFLFCRLILLVKLIILLVKLIIISYKIKIQTNLVWIDEDELLDKPWQFILRVFTDSLVDIGAVECE